MALPLDLVIVRHGESEGNLVYDKRRDGGDIEVPLDLAARSHVHFRLTTHGTDQAQAAGVWLRQAGLHFDHRRTSPFIRAMETALELGVGDEWHVDMHLREREWGRMYEMGAKEMEVEFVRERHDPFYWRSPDGDSVADTCLRIEHVLSDMAEACPDGRAIIVTHAVVVQALCFALEDWDVVTWIKNRERLSPHNCQIYHYTRTNPNDPDDIRPRFSWMRTACPADPTLELDEGWQLIERRARSAAELWDEIKSYPRLIDRD